jgi:uroporphyrinogen-III synthase
MTATGTWRMARHPAAAITRAPPLAGFTVGVTADRSGCAVGRLLERSGARVLSAPAVTVAEPPRCAAVQRLIGGVRDGTVDALAFTGAPAVSRLLRVAAHDGVLGELLSLLDSTALPACVGPVTAAPLRRLGVATMVPERHRPAALARLVAAELPRRRARQVVVGGYMLDLRSHAVVIDGTAVRPVPPAPMAVLRVLAERPGHVVGRARLRRILAPGAIAREHAVDVAVARLRGALGAPELVQTVIKRGYRLGCLPAEM